MTGTTDRFDLSRYRAVMPAFGADRHAVTAKLLVADADVGAAEALVKELGRHGIECSRVASASEALRDLDALPIDVAIVDHSLTDADGTLLARLRSEWPSLPVIVSGPAADEALRLAIDAGAADYLSKPFDPDEALFMVEKALEQVARSIDVPPPPVTTAAPRTLFGESAVMREALQTLERAAAGSATILVRGESGTGKELVARAIHDASTRRSRPFVKIDCASLPDQLLESELFGYEKGAFTGAVSRKPGRVELADGGTLFLDEIGELTAPIQGKLLRLLQDRELERLGGTKTISVDVRVVAATHRDLETMVERGQFRQDLFYRLNVVPLWLPPLRARRDDVELLARHFCKLAVAANGRRSVVLDDDAVRLLRRQRWPGNVRQLQNFVERLVVLCAGGTISQEDVRHELERQVKFITQPSTTTLSQQAPRADASAPAVGSSVLALSEELRMAEQNALTRALSIAEGNRSRAARLLGISRSTLYAKLTEYGLV